MAVAVAMGLAVGVGVGVAVAAGGGGGGGGGAVGLTCTSKLCLYWQLRQLVIRWILRGERDWGRGGGAGGSETRSNLEGLVGL